MPRTASHPSTVDIVGVHVGDDAVHLLRVSAAGGTRTITSYRALTLADGAVEHGVVRAAGVLPPSTARAAVSIAGGAPVRIALTTRDCAVVSLSGEREEPLAALTAIAAASGRPGDAVWADVVSSGGRAVGLVGALRSSVLRTTAAFERAGLRVTAIEGAPVSLVAAATALVALPAGTWTARCTAPPLDVRTSVSRSGRPEGAVVRANEACAAAFTLSSDAPGSLPIDLLEAMRDRLGRRAAKLTAPSVASFALAFGAALGGLPRALDSPDLRAAVVVRPLVTTGGALPRWAVEPLPRAANDVTLTRARPIRRRVARGRP